jgi:O-antigen ligase
MLLFTLIITFIALFALLGAGIFPGLTLFSAAVFTGVLALQPASGESGGRRPALAAGLFLAFLLLTMFPVPAAWHTGPTGDACRHAEQFRQSAQVAGLVDTPTTPFRFSYSLNRAGTGRYILLAITTAAAAMLTARMNSRWKQRMLFALILIGTLIAAAGLVSQWVFPQGKTLWWTFPVPHGQPVGCFINRNHFGGFVAMLVPLALVGFADAALRRRFLSALFYLTCAGCMGAAVILSLSKGAWLALAVGVGVVSLLPVLYRRYGISLLLTSMSTLLLAATLFQFRGLIADRIGELRSLRKSQSLNLRIDTWLDTLPIIRTYPIGGVGANAFRMVFPQHRTASTRSSFAHAENEYLQTPAELGAGGALLLGWLLIESLRYACRQRDPIPGGAIREIAALAALAAVAAHAGVDYAVRVPLYTLTFGVVLGCAIRQPQETGPCRRPRLPLLALLAIAGVSLLGTRITRMDDSDAVNRFSTRELFSALEWSPVSWQIWYNLGRQTQTQSCAAPDPKLDVLAERAVSTAAAYDPNRYLLWKQIALMRWSLNNRSGALAAYERARALRTWLTIPELEPLRKAEP